MNHNIQSERSHPQSIKIINPRHSPRTVAFRKTSSLHTDTLVRIKSLITAQITLPTRVRAITKRSSATAAHAHDENPAHSRACHLTLTFDCARIHSARARENCYSPRTTFSADDGRELSRQRRVQRQPLARGETSELTDMGYV